MTELLTALNAIRAAYNGAAPTTWSAILPGGTPAPLVDGDVYAQLTIRSRGTIRRARRTTE